jgi:ubiquinone/menaquinone biosynthesis C-methylase UbiE
MADIITDFAPVRTSTPPGVASVTSKSIEPRKAHSQFVGSIPDIYDSHLGPLLFEFAAADLAKRVAKAIPRGGKVLEVACGTGISTEHLWRALAPGSEIVATDLNEAMLDFARQRRGNLSNVTYRQANALELPFADASFDVIVCQFGLMFFADKAKSIAEMTRVLRPGGLLTFNVWDSLSQNKVAQIALETIAEFFETDPPDFLSVPFGYHDVDVIRDLLRDAGYRATSASVVSATVDRPDALCPAKGFVEGNPGILQIRERASADPEEIVAALAQAYDAAFGPAPLHIPLKEIVFAAVKP